MTTDPSRRAWARLVVLALHQLVAWGVLFYAYTVLAAPMATSLSVSRTRIAASFSLALLAGGLVARRVGVALDRFGPRRVMAAGALVSAVSFAGLTVVRHELALAACFVALGVGHSMVLYEAAFRAVVDWFPLDAERRKALLLVTIVGGFASTVFLPLTNAYVVRDGFRHTILVLTAVFAVASTLTFWVMPRDRRVLAAETKSVIASAPPRSVHWLAVAFAVHAFAGMGVMVNLVPYLSDRWHDAARAALFAGLAGASQVPGRIFVGVSSAAPSGRRLVVLFGVQAIALVALVGSFEVVVLTGLFAFGVSSGMMTLERANLVADWYGRDEYATRSGQILAPAMMLRAAAPFAVELARATSGGYRMPFMVLGCLVAVGTFAAAIAARTHEEEQLSSRADAPS